MASKKNPVVVVKKAGAAKAVAPVKHVSELARRRALFRDMTDAEREAMVDEICELISSSEKALVVHLKSNPDYPNFTMWWVWLDSHPELADKYARAKRAQAEYMEGRLNEIADNEVREAMIGQNGRPLRDSNGDPIMYLSKTAVAHARLRIDTRKWLMAHLAPKKYGDRTIIAGDPDAPLAPKQDLSNLSKEELAQLIALQTKAEGGKK